MSKSISINLNLNQSSFEQRKNNLWEKTHSNIFSSSSSFQTLNNNTFPETKHIPNSDTHLTSSTLSNSRQKKITNSFVPKYIEESPFSRKSKEMQTYSENLTSSRNKSESQSKFDLTSKGFLQKSFVTDNKKRIYKSAEIPLSPKERKLIEDFDIKIDSLGRNKVKTYVEIDLVSSNSFFKTQTVTTKNSQIPQTPKQLKSQNLQSSIFDNKVSKRLSLN